MTPLLSNLTSPQQSPRGDERASAHTTVGKSGAAFELVFENGLGDRSARQNEVSKSADKKDRIEEGKEEGDAKALSSPQDADDSSELAAGDFESEDHVRAGALNAADPARLFEADSSLPKENTDGVDAQRVLADRTPALLGVDNGTFKPGSADERGTASSTIQLRATTPQGDEGSGNSAKDSEPVQTSAGEKGAGVWTLNDMSRFRNTTGQASVAGAQASEKPQVSPAGVSTTGSLPADIVESDLPDSRLQPANRSEQIDVKSAQTDIRNNPIATGQAHAPPSDGKAIDGTGDQKPATAHNPAAQPSAAPQVSKAPAETAAAQGFAMSAARTQPNGDLSKTKQSLLERRKDPFGMEPGTSPSAKSVTSPSNSQSHSLLGVFAPQQIGKPTATSAKHVASEVAEGRLVAFDALSDVAGERGALSQTAAATSTTMPTRGDIPVHVARQMAEALQHHPNKPVEITLSWRNWDG